MNHILDTLQELKAEAQTQEESTFCNGMIKGLDIAIDVLTNEETCVTQHAAGIWLYPTNGHTPPKDRRILAQWKQPFENGQYFLPVFVYWNGKTWREDVKGDGDLSYRGFDQELIPNSLSGCEMRTVDPFRWAYVDYYPFGFFTEPEKDTKTC